MMVRYLGSRGVGGGRGREGEGEGGGEGEEGKRCGGVRALGKLCRVL